MNKKELRRIVSKEVKNVLREMIEQFEDIEKTAVHSIMYHGAQTSDGEVFLDFDPSIYGEYDATWFASEESIAEQFSKWHYDPDETQVVYKVRINSDNIADLRSIDVRDLLDELAMSDPRELISLLSQDFEGWVTDGSIGRGHYEDVAIFDTSTVEILEFKLKTKDGWTEYKSIDLANEEDDEEDE